MTPSELKYNVESRGTETHFFSRQSMAFFGDTMRNYGVRRVTVQTAYDAEGNYVGNEGISVECWELYRKRPVKHGVQKSTFFSVNTFNIVFPLKD